ncbi:MAG: hypothetical protein L0191_00775 [Acidobacteria bacterium]|nr:hypothetical protein [Acidobacteriota bacterium]MCI0567468.1 hypothetical protein [Acidobacteriota bacterium]
MLLSIVVAATPIPQAAEQVPRGALSYGAGKVAKPEFKDLVRRADLIVLGKIVEIGPISHSGPSKKQPKSKQYTYWESSFAVIQIEQTIKGKARGAKVKIAYKSDLEGDHTTYQAGKSYVVFLTNPKKFPDAYTTTAYHYGEFRINDQGRAERVHDSSEMSKPVPVLIDNIRKALGKPATSAS